MEKEKDFLPESESKEEASRGGNKDDGLSFDCEICTDSGCNQCGWGKNREEAA